MNRHMLSQATALVVLTLLILWYERLDVLRPGTERGPVAAVTLPAP